MKKYKEAEVEVVRFENSVIATSWISCPGNAGCSYVCDGNICNSYGCPSQCDGNINKAGDLCREERY